MDIASLRAQHPDHWKKACAIRVLTLDAVAAANSGHSGMPMGMADVATVLFEKHLNFDPSAPLWPNRDRFILSAGHGSMLIYSLLHLTGYKQATLDELKNFRQWGARTAGHPEYGHLEGVETTTGPLGQGIANSVGFAMAEESLRARWGAKVMDHYTYVIAGDGCLMEGVSQEAIALAGKHQLSRLIVLWDNNGITIDGKVELSDITDQKARFAASGWDVFECDGHDPVAIDAAITAAKASPRPAMIACKTHIALGSSAQDTSKGHGALTDKQLIADTRAVYGWDHGPFEIPHDIKKSWEAIGHRGVPARKEWEMRGVVMAGFFGSMSQLIAAAGGENKKAAMFAKHLAVLEVAMNTAVAVSKVWSQTGIFGAMAIAAPIMSGAAQIAVIEGLQFAKGGIVPGQSYSGDNVQARLNSGEMVLNRVQQVRLFDIADGRENARSAPNYTIHYSPTFAPGTSNQQIGWSQREFRREVRAMLDDPTFATTQGALV